MGGAAAARTAALTLPALVFTTACAGSPSPLDPRTTAAARIAELGWLLIGLGAAASVVTIGALIVALRVAGRRERADTLASDTDSVVVVWGMALPALVIVVALGSTIYTLRNVAGAGGPGGAVHAHNEHAGGADSGAAELTLEVTGRQWWWEVRYPSEQVITANEFHIPAGVPVRLAVTSVDVIHSFWIPQLIGKVDMIPDKTNAVTIRAEQPGIYRGMCGEFCGLQHAHMHVHVYVDNSADFAAWLARQRQNSFPPTDPVSQRGQQVFVDGTCAECHTVRGTVAAGTRGPDLTHIASRRWLGAGIHANNRVNLAGWAVNAQAMKPGNKMPAIPLADADLQALLAYLETLE
jgi:cytochrome c oxidase subunit II